MPITFESLDASEGRKRESGDPDKQPALRSSLVQALPLAPDQYAEAKMLGEQTRLPAPVVARNLDTVRRRADLESIAKYVKDIPALAVRLEDPEFAKVAHDDVPTLGEVANLFREQGFGAAGPALRQAKQQVPSPVRYPDATTVANPRTVTSGLLDALPSAARGLKFTLRQMYADVFGTPADQEQVQYQRRKAEDAVGAAAPEFETRLPIPGTDKTFSLTRGAYGGARSLIQGAPTLIASMAAGSAIPALAGAGALTQTEAYGRYRERGATPGEALAGSTGEAAVEVGTELLPMGFLVKSLGRAGAGEFLAGFLAREVPGEQLATLLQDALDTAIANPNKTWAEFIAERPEAQAETLVATLVQSGAISAVGAASQALAKPREQAAKAQQNGEMLQRLTELAKASALAQRDPASFEQFIQAAAEDGPVEDVYVDGRVFAQALETAGIPVEQIQSALPAAAGQIGEAVATGGLVKIPVGEFAAKIATSDLGAALLPHLKVSPNDLSMEEAKEFSQSEAGVLKAEAEAFLERQGADAAHRESTERVRQVVLGNLNETRRFTREVNDAYATLTGLFFSTTAQRLGTTPEELFARYPVEVRNASQAGGRQLDQGPSPLSDLLDRYDAVDKYADTNGITEQDLAEELRAIDNLPAAVADALETFRRELAEDFDVDGGRGDASAYQEPLVEAVRREVARERKGAAPQTGSPEFKAWFGDSKVVDADGTPLVVYPGTRADFDTFKSPSGSDLGFHFGSAQQADGRGGTRLMGASNTLTLPVYLSIENPLRVTDPGYFGVQDPSDNAFALELRSLGVEAVPGMSNAELARAIEAAGYDGLVYENESEGEGGTSWAALRPEQIKSAVGNRGTFDPNDPSILNQGVRANINFGKGIGRDPAVISLLENADLSSYLHETGHFFLEVMTDIANRPDAPAEIQQDVQTFLASVGVKDLPTWNAMTLEQQREHHETFARSFEAYLFDGKSPNLEVQGLFARFRAWLLNVYRQLNALNVNLTDEVRGVFDRMLATDAQIQQAEAAAGYTPLFKSVEEATKAGMTPEQYNEYVLSGQEATQDGMDKLQSRGLRDMKWLRNARGRELKKLQRSVEAKRLQVRDEVAEEVWNQPIYRAWQFIRFGAVELSDDIPHRLDVKALADIYGETDPPPEPKVQSADEFAEEARLRFLKLLKRGGGIATSEAADISGDSIQRAVRMAPGLFRKDGRGLDVIAQDLAGRSDSYISATDAEDVDGGLQTLRDLVRTAMDGAPVFTQAEAARHAEMIQEEANRAQRDREGEVERAAIRAESAPNWRKLGVGTGGFLAAKNGAPPAALAELFGFTSADHMIRELLAAQPPHEVIEGMTDQRLLERYGDLTTEAGIQRAADEAVHNAARARLLATEINALNTALGQRKILAKAAKAFAEATVARRRIRDATPGQFTAAEAKAARAAERAKDLAVKAAEKRNQLVQHYAARAAYNAQDDVESGLRYLRNFNKDSIRTKVDPDQLEQIDFLLEKVDLHRTSRREVDRRKSLVEWAEAQREAGFDPPFDPNALEAMKRQPYQDMTVEEFRGFVDAIKAIDHVGRVAKLMLTARKDMLFEQARDEVVASIKENAKGERKERRVSDRTPLVEPLRMFEGFLADHRKFASLVREWDGFKDGGPAWELVVRGMNAAGGKEASERAKATREMSRILKPLLKGRVRQGATRGSLVSGHLGEKFATSWGQSFTREERIGIALNAGNAVNRERVLTGERWSPVQLQEVLDSLTKEEMDTVQALWDYIDSFWPAVADKQRRLTGVVPEKVEAEQLVTRHGTYRGGYYPIAYDPLLSERSRADTEAEVEKQLTRGLYTAAQTRRGHTKARSESTGRTLRYDLGTIFRHVDQVIHDLSWHEWLIDANKLFKDSRVEDAVRTHYGTEKLRTMKATLVDIAVGDLAAQSDGARLLNGMRHGATIVGLGWRLSTSLLQPLGLTQSISRIGAKWVAKGAVHWLRDASGFQNSVRIIGEKSDFMRLRAQTMQREINEIRNQVKGTDSKLEASYFWMIQKMQLVADVPTWWGGYEKAMHDQPDEARAIALADQAVRDAQGGGQIADLAAIQRGHPAWKLFTTFYSFFNTTYNLTAEAVGRTNFKKPKDVALLAADLALLYTVPAMLGTILKAVLNGDWEDEDKFVRQLVNDQISYLLGTVVLLRESGSAVRAALGLPGDYGGPAALRFFGELSRLGKQVGQGEVDEAFWRSFNQVGGLVFHYPAGQVQNTLEGAAALADGKTSNPGALLVGAPD